MGYEITRLTIVDVTGRDAEGRPVKTNLANQRSLEAPLGMVLVGHHVVQANDDVHLVCIWRSSRSLWFVMLLVCAAVLALGYAELRR